MAGLNSDFTSLTGDVAMTFSTAQSQNLSFELLLGTSVDLSPVTATTSMNTSGDVTVNWTTPNASTSAIQVMRSDDGGASFSDISGDLDADTTTFTDPDSDPNAVYQVTETEFATGWLKVASAAANVGPTVTVNLTDDNASAGVTFTADEGNSDLLDVYVGTGSSPTTQIDLSQISTLVVNTTVSGANLTFDGGLTCAVTVNGDGGTDSITLDAGTWGDGGTPLVYAGTTAYNLSVVDGAYVTFAATQHFANLAIGADSVVSADYQGDYSTISGTLELDEGGTLEIPSSGFTFTGSDTSNEGTIEITGWGYILVSGGSFTNDNTLDITGGSLDIYGGGMLENYGVINIVDGGALYVVDGATLENENVVNIDGSAKLDICDGTFLNESTVNFLGEPALTIECGGAFTNDGTVNWYAANAAGLSLIDNEGTVIFQNDVDLSGATLSGRNYEIAGGVTVSVSSDLAIDAADFRLDAGAALEVTGGTLTVDGGTSEIYGLITVDDAALTVAGGNYFWVFGDLELNHATWIVAASGEAGITSPGVLNVNNGSTLEIAGEFATYGTLNVNDGGIMTINSGAYYLYLAGTTGTIMNISSSAVVTNHATIYWEGGEIGSLFSVDNEGTIVFDADVDLSGLTRTGGTYEISANVTATVGGDFTMSDGTTLTVDSGATLTVDSSATITLDATSSIVNYGTINLPAADAGLESYITNVDGGTVNILT